MSDVDRDEFPPQGILQTFGEVEWCSRAGNAVPLCDAYRRLFRRALACATLAESGPRGFVAALHYPSVVNWQYPGSSEETVPSADSASDTATAESAQSQQ